MATSTINQPPRQASLVSVNTVNQTCSASSTNTLTLNEPTVPAGFTNLGIVSITFSSTGTTDAFNASFMTHVTDYANSYGYQAVVRNHASAAAKFTVIAKYLLARG